MTGACCTCQFWRPVGETRRYAGMGRCVGSPEAAVTAAHYVCGDFAVMGEIVIPAAAQAQEWQLALFGSETLSPLTA